MTQPTQTDPAKLRADIQQGMVERLEWFDAHYGVLSIFAFQPGSDPVYLRGRSKQACRYCGRADPEVKFKHVASGDFEAALPSRKMACFLDCLTEHRLAELMAHKKTWSAAQTDTFELLHGLIDHSGDVRNALIHRITTMDSEWKNHTFMHGLQPAPNLLWVG